MKADLQIILQSACFAKAFALLFQDYKLKPFKSCTVPFDPGQILFGQIRKSPTLFDCLFPELRIIQMETSRNGFRKKTLNLWYKTMSYGFPQNTLCKNETYSLHRFTQMLVWPWKWGKTTWVHRNLPDLRKDIDTYEYLLTRLEMKFNLICAAKGLNSCPNCRGGVKLNCKEHL